MENDLEVANEFANLTFLYGGRIALTSEQLKRYQNAVKKLIEENEKISEYKNKYHIEEIDINEVLEEYKKLDEKNFGYTTKIALLEAEIIENEKDKKKNYIPKSKVIDELKKLDEDGYWDFLMERDLEKCCEILRGLIEEKEKENE